MTVQAFRVLTAVQNDDIAAISATDPSPGVTVAPRVIDNALADLLGLGTLVGNYVAPAALSNDSAYDPWDVVLDLAPIHLLDTDTLFVPITI